MKGTMMKTICGAVRPDNWTKIKPYSQTDEYTVWINGIYKIVSYNPGEYLAFYISDTANNWGDYVCKPPHDLKFGKGWTSLKAAKDDCKAHAETHKPGRWKNQRAGEIMAIMIQMEQEAGV